MAHYDIFREQKAATYSAFGHALRTSCGDPLRSVGTLRDSWRARGGPYQVEGGDSDFPPPATSAVLPQRGIPGIGTGGGSVVERSVARSKDIMRALCDNQWVSFRPSGAAQDGASDKRTCIRVMIKSVSTLQY